MQKVNQSKTPQQKLQKAQLPKHADANFLIRREIASEFGLAYRNGANKVAAGDVGVRFLH